MDNKKVDILIIEDNPNDAELTIRALKDKNVSNNIIVLEDGQEALDYLFCKKKYKDRNFNNKPKVILLDLKLPKVNGLEVLKELKSKDQTKTIPVVMLTSSTEENDLVESYKLGVNSYLVKPVDFNKFSESIENLGFYWILLNKAPE